MVLAKVDLSKPWSDHHQWSNCVELHCHTARFEWVYPNPYPLSFGDLRSQPRSWPISPSLSLSLWLMLHWWSLMIRFGGFCCQYCVCEWVLLGSCCDWVLGSIFVKFWLSLFSFYWPVNPTNSTAWSDHLIGWSTDWLFGNSTQSGKVINFPQTRLTRAHPLYIYIIGIVLFGIHFSFSQNEPH